MFCLDGVLDKFKFLFSHCKCISNMSNACMMYLSFSLLACAGIGPVCNLVKVLLLIVNVVGSVWEMIVHYYYFDKQTLRMLQIQFYV